MRICPKTALNPHQSGVFHLTPSDTGVGLDDYSRSVIPELKTDVFLRGKDRNIIIDTKYYASMLQRGYMSEKENIRRNHLSQMETYLTSAQEDEALATTDWEGILLYPTVEEDRAAHFEVAGHRLSVQTINLAQEWEGIATALLAVPRGEI